MSNLGKAKSEHRRIREMLSVYIDGELSSSDRARVKEHLAECADCTWELETLRQTVDLVGQLPKVPVPRAFTIQEKPRPRWVNLLRLFQTRWAYTYLRGATALAAALLILVLAGDALIQFQRVTTSFAPAMAPAKEVSAPPTAPTVVAMQEAPSASPEASVLPEEDLGEAEGVAYAEDTPSPSSDEEAKTLALMPTPTAPAAVGGEPTATSLATPAPLIDKAEGRGTPLPSAAMEAPAEEAPQVPAALATAPTATPQPQMTVTASPTVPLPASAVPSATPTSMALVTATSVPTTTPLSMARAPAEVRPTEEKGALAAPSARPQPPGLTLLRVVEASLCLLVMALMAATLIVRQRSEA